MKKILIVEDEEPILRLLAEQFRKNNFEVFEAKDGEQGLKLAEEKKPDLIILDLFMPKKNGVAMLAELRESGEWGRQVPVVVLTNFLTKITKEEVLAHQVLDFIVKTDLNLNHFIKTVKNHLYPSS